MAVPPGQKIYTFLVTVIPDAFPHLLLQVDCHRLSDGRNRSSPLAVSVAIPGRQLPVTTTNKCPHQLSTKEKSWALCSTVAQGSCRGTFLNTFIRSFALRLYHPFIPASCSTRPSHELNTRSSDRTQQCRICDHFPVRRCGVRLLLISGATLHGSSRNLIKTFSLCSRRYVTSCNRQVGTMETCCEGPFTHPEQLFGFIDARTDHIPKDIQKRSTYNPPFSDHLTSATDTELEFSTSKAASLAFVPGTSVSLSTSAPCSTGPLSSRLPLSTGPSSFSPSSTARVDSTSSKSGSVIFHTTFTWSFTTVTGGTGTGSSSSLYYNTSSTYYRNTSTLTTCTSAGSSYVLPTNPTAPILSTGPPSEYSTGYGSSATPPYANSTSTSASSTILVTGTGTGTGTAPTYLSSVAPPYTNSTGPCSTSTPFGSTGLPPIPTLTPISSLYTNSTSSSSTSCANGTLSIIEPTPTSDSSSSLPLSTGATSPYASGTGALSGLSTTGIWTNCTFDLPSSTTTDYESSPTTDIGDPSTTTPGLPSDSTSSTSDTISSYTSPDAATTTIIITVTVRPPEESSTTSSETEVPITSPEESSTVTDATSAWSSSPTTTNGYATYITLTPIESSTSGLDGPSSSFGYSISTSTYLPSSTDDVVEPSSSPSSSDSSTSPLSTTNTDATATSSAYNSPTDTFVLSPSPSTQISTNTDATATSSAYNSPSDTFVLSPSPSTQISTNTDATATSSPSSSPFPSTYSTPPTDTSTYSVPSPSSSSLASSVSPSTFLTSVSSTSDSSSSGYSAPTLEAGRDMGVSGMSQRRWWGWGGERDREDREDERVNVVSLREGEGEEGNMETGEQGESLNKAPEDGERDVEHGDMLAEGRKESGKKSRLGRRLVGMYFL
ncbi:uncharacterized protein EI97DRAFT_440992 [Westerdykella ornata]|uniref:Uncharacterized protein n=1 Tax=Westerdykella ornata TaxID=318751 RepID=A0A6A6JR17_WESOR|nr:uncharacterized protein EI97DRAFT_440992 [Westerdykella ornata]KAF2278543.1 hypothetical protein EI97DRAFT_440992 [Westerdykella ornata]